MKKILSLLLAVIMIILTIPCAFATEKSNVIIANSIEEVIKNEKQDYPIVFVTGIGQTYSYVLDDNGENSMIFNGDEYKYNTAANLFIFDGNQVVSHIFSNLKSIMNTVLVAFQIVKTLATGKYSVNYDRLCALAADLLYLNVIDENGKLPENVITPRYTYPLSEYEEYGKERFYKTIPIREVLEAYGEDKVFCYNFAPFGSLQNVADGLNDFINNTVQKYYPDTKVVLIPMSMGAAMVNQYLYDYGSQNDVAKVVSVVGCWNGSDIFPDLIEKKYAEDSHELFYNGVFTEMLGDAYGNLLNCIFHIFPQKALAHLVSNVVGALCDELFLKTPTLLALIPSYRYEKIRDEYLTKPGYENVLKEMDKFHQVQLTTRDRMYEMNRTYGTEFYFICGYNLQFGVGTPYEYYMFQLLDSAKKVNSDEIIQVESTSMGATSAIAGQTLSEEYIKSAKNPQYISPDKSIDVSTAAFPDRCWMFYNQKHELEYNNTALRLAFEIAKGNITDVNSDPEHFPQFNGARNLEFFKTEHLPVVEAFIEKYDGTGEYPEYVEKCKKLIAEADEMMARTINNPEVDYVILDEFKNFSQELIVLENGNQKTLEDFLAPITTKLNKIIYSITGPKGFPDLF